MTGLLTFESPAADLLTHRDEPAVNAPVAVKPPPGNPRFPLFDSARALAATSVLVFHAALATEILGRSWFGPILQQLKVGVAVFFAISGFLLYRPFVAARFDGRPPRRIRDYARSRLLRIVPAYWLALTLIGLWPGLKDVFTTRWAIYYFFGQVYWKSTAYNGLVPAWTLCVEITFYAFLPAYALLLRRSRPRLGSSMQRQELAAILSLGVGSLLLRGLIPWHAMTLSLPGNLDWFAIGMALAVVSVGAERGTISRRATTAIQRVSRVSWLLAGAFLALAAYLEHTARPPLAVHFVYGLIGLTFLLPACFAGAGLKGSLPCRLLAQRWLAWLGLISYGIYLWHWRLVYGITTLIADRHVPGSAFAMVAVVAFALTVACAAASYYIVERPALGYKVRRRVVRHDLAEVPQATPG